jgi:hypothetical protein
MSYSNRNSTKKYGHRGAPAAQLSTALMARQRKNKKMVLEESRRIFQDQQAIIMN